MDVLKTGINNLYLGKNVEKMKARKLKQEQEQNRKIKVKMETIQTIYKYALVDNIK